MNLSLALGSLMHEDPSSPSVPERQLPLVAVSPIPPLIPAPRISSAGASIDVCRVTRLQPARMNPAIARFQRFCSRGAHCCAELHERLQLAASGGDGEAVPLQDEYRSSQLRSGFERHELVTTPRRQIVTTAETCSNPGAVASDGRGFDQCEHGCTVGRFGGRRHGRVS